MRHKGLDSSRKSNNSRRPRGRPVEEGGVFTLSWRSKTDDTLDRTAAIRSLWVADAEWHPAWRAFVADVARETAAWPGLLAQRVGAVKEPDAQRALPWSEEPHRGPGPYPAPMLRPLFEALASRTTPSGVRIGELLEAPAAPPIPRRPKTSAEARQQYLRARTEYTRARITIRHGHCRREDLREAIAAAQERFKAIWYHVWLSMLDDVVGNEVKARALAERLRAESLATLGALFGARRTVEAILADEPAAPEAPKQRAKRHAARARRKR